jgi:hypothetical protein
MSDVDQMIIAYDMKIFLKVIYGLWIRRGGT